MTNLDAQKDFGFWSGVEINAPVTKDFKIGLEAETRFDRNVSRMKTAFLSPFVNWDASKYFRAGLNYRLSSSPYNDLVDNRIFSHRYGLDLEFRNIMDLIRENSTLGLTLRFRGTREYEDMKRTDNYLRLRIKADYAIAKSKFEPYCYLELFYHINDQITYTFTKVNSDNTINKFRASIGFKYAVSKQHEIRLFSIYQRQLLKSADDIILGVGYVYSFKKAKGTQ